MMTLVGKSTYLDVNNWICKITRQNIPINVGITGFLKCPNRRVNMFDLEVI